MGHRLDEGLQRLKSGGISVFCSIVPTDSQGIETFDRYSASLRACQS